jgi:3-phosphoshikimate 1-carboxyvinyltransferase
MSIETLARFGGDAHADFDSGNFQVPGKQRLRPCKFLVEGDYSSAAFMIAAGLLRGRVEVGNLLPYSRQGDRAVLEIYERMGGNVAVLSDRVQAGRSHFHGIEVDARQIPDLVPILAVVASQAEGRTTIAGVGRLRLKESDRIEAVVGMLSKMGADIKAAGDTIIVEGRTTLKGAEIDPRGDHRIAMASAVAALVAEGETVIENAECVSKSYPEFFNDLMRIGVEVEVL